MKPSKKTPAYKKAIEKIPAKKTAKGKPAKKAIPIFKAPADFKPHFLLVQVATEKDGLLGIQAKATRYQGKFDREAADKKKFDLGSYDQRTLMGIQARLSAVTFKPTNDRKYDVNPKNRVNVKGSHRLPASTIFQILMRAGKKSADQSLTASVKNIWQIVQNEKTGRQGLKELEKTDPVYRMIRRASRFLPAAFKEVQMPPKRTRGKVEEE